MDTNSQEEYWTIPEQPTAKRITPISAYRKDTGEFVGTYPSQIECGKKLGLNNRKVSDVLTGKLKSTAGYIFKKEVK